MLALTGWIGAPKAAKFAPCRKFPSIASRYELKYGNSNSSAASRDGEKSELNGSEMKSLHPWPNYEIELSKPQSAMFLPHFASYATSPKSEEMEIISYIRSSGYGGMCFCVSFTKFCAVIAIFLTDL